jgi:hypothetical protein
MKIKTSELTGAALDWAVAKCEGLTSLTAKYPNGSQVSRVLCAGGAPFDMAYGRQLRYSADWSQGGPIIERERITTVWTEKSGFWTAYLNIKTKDAIDQGADGPTPLIAAMRCCVASKLGDEVDVPGELL